MSDGATMSTPASAWHSACVESSADHGRIVGDVAGLVEQAVLAVAGVRIERDVGHDPRTPESAASSARTALRHQPLRIPGRARVQRFAVRRR